MGRGVLIDFYSYAKKSYDPFSSRVITADELRACAVHQRITFEYGDILIVRTGWSEKYKTLDQKGREELAATEYNRLAFAGMDRARSMVEFLHDNYFSAVASDTVAFESWPYSPPKQLHQYLLPLWGCPIGEMWDLEHLAELCQKHDRWSFLLTSCPANVTGKIRNRNHEHVRFFDDHLLNINSYRWNRYFS